MVTRSETLIQKVQQVRPQAKLQIPTFTPVLKYLILDL